MSPLKELHVLEGHEDCVWSLAWSPSGDKIASCGGDKTVRIWRPLHGTNEWHCAAVLEDIHQRTIRALDWDASGTRIATASFDGTTAIWLARGEEWECVSTLEGHENEVKSVAWNPAGAMLATCGRDKTVWIWEMQPDHEFECVSVLQGHSQDVKQVLWDASGEMLFSCSYDNSIKLWMEDPDEDDWVCTQTLSDQNSGHQSTVWGIALDASGRWLASCSHDLSTIVWEHGADSAVPGKGWRHACSISGAHDRPIYSVHWNCTGDLLATASGDNSARILVRDQAQKETSFQPVATAENAHEGDVNCIRWHPKVATVFATAGDDGMVKIWECAALDTLTK
ncbi:hypothetical protein CYMTET_50590 [Cymbomonas tetramitiformis]|uniref:Probable cytosolic iron-sulfur protein assembly protein CIAO1 homolog n=1 Tax=Cymbomonas tetramitiformis TaxID=36881 RepID=A0AAE0BMT3_9CHLO|nr:hypothetical protein CYMTET_50590 [Cymbomonas tetramitiformis]